MEITPKNIQVYGMGCLGCQSHSKDVMVSLTVDGPKFVDVYITDEEALALSDRLKQTVEANARHRAETEPKKFDYFIDLDERGEFRARVDTAFGKTVFEFEGAWMFEDGFMKDKHDLEGLKEYLVEHEIMSSKDELPGL